VQDAKIPDSSRHQQAATSRSRVHSITTMFLPSPFRCYQPQQYTIFLITLAYSSNLNFFVKRAEQKKQQQKDNKRRW